jgi:hypothetical protein
MTFDDDLIQAEDDREDLAIKFEQTGHVDHLFQLGVNSMFQEDMYLVVQPF